MIGLYNFSVAILAGLAFFIIVKIIWSRENARKPVVITASDNAAK